MPGCFFWNSFTAPSELTEENLIIAKQLELTYQDFRSALLGYLKYDPELKKQGELSLSSLSLFRVLEYFSEGSASINELHQVIANWNEYRERLRPKDNPGPPLFPAVFISLFLYFRNFPLLFSSFEKILVHFEPDGLNSEDVKAYFSLCAAAVKTRASANEFDEEAFLFFLLNSDAANSEIFPGPVTAFENISRKLDGEGAALESLSQMELLVMNILYAFRGVPSFISGLSESNQYFTGFLTGLFHRNSLPTGLEEELTVFISETLDNFWCLINEEHRDDLSV